MLYAFLMQYQLAPYVVGEIFLCGFHILLIVSSRILYLFLMVYRYIS